MRLRTLTGLIGLLALQACSKVDKANDLVAKASSIVETRTLNRDSLRAAYNHAENVLRLADYDSTKSRTTIRDGFIMPIAKALELQGDINQRLSKLPYDSLIVACEDPKYFYDRTIHAYLTSLKYAENSRIVAELARFDVKKDPERALTMFKLAEDYAYRDFQTALGYAKVQYEHERKYPYTEKRAQFQETARILRNAPAKTSEEIEYLKDLRKILDKHPDRFLAKLEKLTASLN